MTIYDVARAAGVSHQTIANVLKAPQRVAPDTRERVQQHIAELGFQPNRLAQNLSRQRSGLLGFRVGSRDALAGVGILDTFLHSMAEAAEALDHHVVLFHSPDFATEVERATELYQRNAADAFVVASTHAGDPRIPAYLANRLRFVTFGRTDHSDAHSWVDTDNVAGGELATRHLLAAGHRTIAFLGWPGDSLVGDDRQRGWQQALQDAGASADESLVVRAVNSRDAAVPLIAALLERNLELTAVVAASDELAVGAQRAALLARRPLSVVGYDDSPLASLGGGLTSIRQPVAAIAGEIVRVAAALADGGTTPTHLSIRPELIVRASTAPDESAARRGFDD